MVSSSGTDPDGVDVAAADPDDATEDLIAELDGVGPNQPVERLRFSSWSIVRAVLLLLIGLVLVRIVGAASTALWWSAIAVAIAALFQPAALYLRRFMPGWLAILTVIVVVLGVIGLVGYRGVNELVTQFNILQNNAISTARDIQGSAQFGQMAREFGLVDKVTSFFQDLPLALGGGDAAAAIQSAASSGGALVAISMLALLMLIFGPRFARGAIAQIDDPAIARNLHAVLATAYRRSSTYVWLMACRAVAIGLIAGIACALLGIEAPTAVGLGFAAMSLIPGVGIVVASLPVAVAEAVTSPASAVAVFLAAVGVQLIDVVVVQRRIEVRSVHVGPALTLVALLIGMQLYGLGGILVALAVTIFGVAFLSTLTEAHPDVPSAFRDLLMPSSATGAGFASSQ